MGENGAGLVLEKKRSGGPARAGDWLRAPSPVWSGGHPLPGAPTGVGAPPARGCGVPAGGGGKTPAGVWKTGGAWGKAGREIREIFLSSD